MIDVVFINSFRNGGKVSSTVVSGYSKAGGDRVERIRNADGMCSGF